MSLKFKKFLQSQAELIGALERRRIQLTGNHVNNKKSHNEFMYTPLPNDDDDVIDINVSVSTQATMSKTTSNQYYQDRTSAVQGIEKTLGDVASMFTRLGQMVYEQRSMIDRLDNNTDISMSNIEKGTKELTEIQRDVRGNRGLIIKIFFILIFTAVVYILFFTQ